jgi:glycosyltransferase involved in cell wall biosynthesis
LDDLRNRNARGVHIDIPIRKYRSKYLRDSLKTAIVAHFAYRFSPFHLLECFDYYGNCWELMRNRQDVIQGNATLDPTFLYLPLEVRVAVRAHGSIEALDEAELPPTSSEVDLVHYLERFALRSADAVLLQSPTMKAVYAKAYSLLNYDHNSQHAASAAHAPAEPLLLLAPPPMKRIFAMSEEGAVQGAKFGGLSCESSAYEMQSPCASTNPLCALFIVIGKLQRVKSPETVAAAFAAMLSSFASSNPSNKAARYEWHLILIGGDATCTTHKRKMSTCVLGYNPGSLWLSTRRIHIRPPIQRGCLTTVVRFLRPVAAIMASEFETFNLVAHELARMSVPLIVADITAFRDYLSDANAYMFQAGNATSLTHVLLHTATEFANGNVLRIAAGISYADPLAPYHLIRSQLRHAASQRVDTQLQRATAASALAAESEFYCKTFF